MRRRANGPTSALAWTASAPSSAASAGSSLSGGPFLKAIPPRRESSSSRHSSMKRVRVAEACRPFRSRGSKQKTGTTRSCPSKAARSAGWSCARRSLVSHTMAVIGPHGSLMSMARTIERFPLFPLGLVLLPHELVPLHIFEDRYKQMIGECLDEQTEFGIIWLSDDGLKETGCSARIARVLERFDDGRLNILVQGTEPFRLLRKIEDLPYPAGDVEVLPDDGEGDDGAADKARRSYADLVEELTESRPEDEALAELDAYGMAATLDVEPAAKQQLLELRSERGRLEQLDSLFAEALERIRLAEFAAERARGNGHLPT